MKGRMRVSSFLLTWILITALTVSPLLAEEQPAPKLRLIELERGMASNNTVQPIDNSVVGTAILMSLPSRAAAAAFPEIKPPGKTKSTVVALLLLGGIATGVLLALSGGGDKKPAPLASPVAAGPAGTVITAGTPRVTTPNQ